METDVVSGRLSKFSVQCTTRLIDYLGEHQSQVFYAGLSIDSIHTLAGPRAPIRIRIGQPVPMDLTDRYEKQGAQPTAANLILAMPIYFFKREHSVRAGHTHTPIPRRTTPTVPDDSMEAFSDHRPSTDSLSLKCPAQDAQEAPRTFVSLVTIIVYFPVSHMRSANNLCTATDQQKRFHLPPHPHEFVAYPNAITLPVEELGDRIVWGFQHLDTLFSKSLELPSELLVEHFRGDNKISNLSKTEKTSGECDLEHSDEIKNDLVFSKNQIPTFAVVSRGVYNRLCTIQRIRAEGINLTQLQKPKANLSRLWYSKVLSSPELIEHRKVSSNSSPNAPDSLQTSSPIPAARTASVSFLRWSGLRVSTGEPHPSSNMPAPVVDLSNLTANEMITTKICRVVFVRRQSFDCSSAIDPGLLSTQFSPAKLRRTRVRGTIHCGIKLKRRCVNVGDVSLTPNITDVNNCFVSPNVVVKRLCGDHGSALCILTSNHTPGSRYLESPGWYTSFHSHTADDSMSPTNPLHSSIAARVKRGTNLMLPIIRRSLESRDETDGHCSSHINEAVIDDLMNDVLTRPRNRAPPRRFDLTDPDLELALKRSLLEQTPVRKRRLEIESGAEAETAQSFKECLSRDAKHVSKPTLRNGKRRYMQKNARRNGIHKQRYRTVPSVRRSSDMKNVNNVIDENTSQIEQTFSEVNQVRDSEPQCNEEMKLSTEESKPNPILPRQGKEQLSCVVSSPFKFIPKLKLAKRRDGKFKILRLARKHIERNSSMKPRVKLQKRSVQCVVRPDLLDKVNSEAAQNPSSTSAIVSTLVHPSPRWEPIQVSNAFYLSPLNLVTHNRTMDSNTTIEQDERSTVEKFGTLVSVHEFKEEWNMLPTHSNTQEAQRFNENVSMLCDTKGCLAPPTMWTQLKTPLPAPEPHLTSLPSLAIIPTTSSHFSTIQTNSLLRTPSYGDPNPPLGSAARFHCDGQESLQKNQLSVSTSDSISSNFLNLPPGYVTMSSCKSTDLDAISTGVNNISNPYVTVSCTKRFMEPFLPSPTPIGSCYPLPLGACANSVNTTLSGFTFPQKQHIQDAFPQPTVPLLIPSYVASWPLPMRGSCNLAQEPPFPVVGNPWDGQILPVNNINTLSKIENMNTMFFIQPTVPNIPYDCTLSTSTWPQPCDTSSWPVVPSYPPVQFIT